MDDQGKYFFKVMVGDFRHQMTIPDKFSQSFRGKILGKVKLQVCNGNTCTVAVAKYRNKLVLKEGWETFVRMHDLRMGDFPVFRCSGNFQFKVLIFDPSGCVKVSSHVAPNIAHLVQQRHENVIEISSSSDDHHPIQFPTSKRQIRLERGDLNMCSKRMKISSSTRPIGAFGKGDVSSSEDSQEVHAVTTCVYSPLTHLTRAQRMKLEKKARAVHSGIPMYVTVMTKCNITRDPCYLGFCRKYADEYLPLEDQMLRLQRNGKRWQVQFQVTKVKLRRLCQGWGQFVSDNKLQIGDTCLFELLKNEKRCTMSVHITRKLSL